MLIGNPDTFAIWFDSVPMWNDTAIFDNGLLVLWVNGNYYPKEIVTATLRREIPLLAQKLAHLPVEAALYHLPAKEAFRQMYKRTFPDDWMVDNDYRFDVTPDALADSNCFIFTVSNGETVRILADVLPYQIDEGQHNLHALQPSETVLPLAEMDDILADLAQVYT